jgi:hypothetical protein|tara:strand:- start:10 stop:210 length:201 start_codon:yes stop_codon:yes gene_type:complete
MQSKHYRLNQDIDANKLMRDIQSMIKSHTTLGRALEDTILSIEIKDIAHTHEEGLLPDDRKNALPE